MEWNILDKVVYDGGFVNMSNVLTIHSCEIYKICDFHIHKAIGIQIVIWLVNLTCALFLLADLTFLVTRLLPLMEAFDIAECYPPPLQTLKNFNSIILWLILLQNDNFTKCLTKNSAYS